MAFLLGLLLTLTSIFLILLVLVQRGRGGGLTGALGGMGGQSAFGAKAGDVFTRITIVAATVWILLCVASVKILGGGDGDALPSDLGAAAAPLGESLTAPDDDANEGTNAPPAGPAPSDTDSGSGGDSAPAPTDGAKANADNTSPKE